jgi:hypothetical protein
MKTHMNTKLVVGSILTLVLGLVIWSPPLQSAEHPEHPAGKTKMKQCQVMQMQKLKLKADLKAQDAELGKQVARMNSASGDRKMSLMAAIITHMVTQRTTMNARQAKMQEGMMQHMSQHIQMGKDSLSQCALMTTVGPKPSRRGEHPEHPEHPKKK